MRVLARKGYKNRAIAGYVDVAGRRALGGIRTIKWLVGDKLGERA